MAAKNQILTVLQPKISIKEMSVTNPSKLLGSGNGELKATVPEEMGALFPLIMINNSAIDENTIMSMVIRQDGFLPTMSITFVDRLAMFSTYHNPIFEPIVSVYIKSQSTSLKPFRGDYFIKNIVSTPVMGEVEHIINLDCELYIPKLYDNVSSSFSNMTSVECLKKIATDLKLGFATNEDSMNDKMTWLNPNLSYFTFIRDEVTKRSYKNESSFFTCFIDRYYILNFINVEKQMSQDKEFDLTHISSDIAANSGVMNGAEQRSKDFDVVSEALLSNHPYMKSNSNFIREFWPVSNNGSILKNQSFRNRVLWYDSEGEKVKSFFLEPISVSKGLNGSIHQVPLMEDLTKMEVKKWLGFDHGNAHKSNKFARMLNHHNNLELNKNLVCVRVYGFNASLLRGMRLPVLFYDDAKMSAIKHTLEGVNQNPDSEKMDHQMDLILSDIYYIKDIIYKYDSMNEGTPFYTEFILSKRNWKKTAYNNA